MILNSVKSPPSVPPRNGSKLEHVEPSSASQPRKYFDSNIEPLAPSPSQASEELVNKSDAKAVTDREKSTDVIDKSSSYRDSWKARSDQQNNSFVFNFVNSKKDVSHIENDGLDLTNRTKKVSYRSLNNKNSVFYHRIVKTGVIKWLNFIQDNIIMTIFSGLRPLACDKVHIYVIVRLMVLNKNPSHTYLALL